MIVTRHALEKKIWAVVDARLNEIMEELDNYASLIKTEMPEHFTGDMGCFEVFDRLSEMYGDAHLSENVDSYVNHMMQLVNASVETLRTGNAILSALGLQD